MDLGPILAMAPVPPVEGKGRKRAKLEEGLLGEAGVKVEPKDLDKMRRIMSTIAKLSLQNAFQIRLLRSVVIQVMLCTKDSPLVECVKAATTRYSEAAKGFDSAEARQAAIGVPHWMAWNALVGFMSDKAEGGSKETVQGYITQASDSKMGLHFYAKHVKTLRLAKAWDKNKIKLEVGVVAETPADRVWGVAKEWMVKSKMARELPGMAPPGHFEDTLQQWLDDMEV